MLPAILIFALPHLFYGLVWIYPNHFLRLFPAGTRAFSTFATLFKGLQLLALLTFTINIQSAYLRYALALIGVGQILNMAIYKAIGHDGVYYGSKLGKPVAMCYGFPFSFQGYKIPHPQYLGSAMTVWAIACVLEQFYVVALCSTVFYALTAYIEDNY